jgi:hypothetical protein
VKVYAVDEELPSPAPPPAAAPKAAGSRPSSKVLQREATQAADDSTQPPQPVTQQPPVSLAADKGKLKKTPSSGGLRVFRGWRTGSDSTPAEEGTTDEDSGSLVSGVSENDSPPLGSFVCQYIGSVPVMQRTGRETVQVSFTGFSNPSALNTRAPNIKFKGGHGLAQVEDCAVGGARQRQGQEECEEAA